MAELIDIFRSLPWAVWVLILTLPVLNLWAICHAALRTFPSGPQERILWVMLAVFIPVLGGIAYLVFGLKRASKPQNP